MSRLSDRLKGAITRDEAETHDEFLQPYGMGRNPFPPARTVWPEVLYNQEVAVDRLGDIGLELANSGPLRRSLGILGGTGVGKTHFLRHAQMAFADLFSAKGLRFGIVEFQVGSGKIQDLVRSIYSSCDEGVRRLGDEDLITSVANSDQLSSEVLNDVSLQDVRVALTRLQDAHAGRSSKQSYEQLREEFKRWIHGATITDAERKHLGVFGRIATGSMSVRVATELFRVAYRLGRLHGVFICLDEIETLWSGGHKVMQVQSFLQDLRFLFDEALKGEEGYSLCIIAASTTTGARSFRQVNQAMFQRLGFEESARVELQPIGSAKAAEEFAREYIEAELKRWSDRTRRKGTTRELLTKNEIIHIYETLVPQRPRVQSRLGGTGEGDVSQAALLDSLHRAVEAKRSD